MKGLGVVSHLYIYTWTKEYESTAMSADVGETVDFWSPLSLSMERILQYGSHIFKIADTKGGVC